MSKVPPSFEVVKVFTGVTVFEGDELECREWIDALLETDPDYFEVREFVW